MLMAAVPLVLCILDGVGVRACRRNNAVRLAKMPFLDALLAKYPNMLLGASGKSVGLPRGTMGNSEVGHITIGSGRVVKQFLLRFQQENLRKNRALAGFVRSASSGVVHFVGLCSDGDVHADLDDAIKVAKIVISRGRKIIWHFISDGRDVNEKSALLYVRRIRRALGRRDFVFGTLSGRYYAMDRNENWDRTRLAFRAIYNAEGAVFRGDIEQAIASSYRKRITDEFISPARFANYNVGVQKNDGVLFFNYRADRARQFLRLLVGARHRKILCFSQYGDGLDKYCPALIRDVPVKNTLGGVLAKHGVSQLRLAETEKYNHVTYFFDAERMVDYPNEKKILVPSPAVATFDMKPGMSAPEITREFLKNIGKFQVVVMNYANGDMVGHTGNKKAAVAAMETLDRCLSKIVPATLKLGGMVLITADHGNAEKMADFWGRKWTAHTTNPVRLIMASNRAVALRRARNAGLANVAPTMLALLGIKPPKEMAAPLIRPASVRSASRSAE
jgi:2,3-bisphosphoglycerate-independent phosphoglycerate mutase